ncbi:MAG: L-seryl-tRNA(Sec) selenium transferase [Synergistaceae bacterium]|nr:L-seryl-tRNA(Sec) selenium transferase [Synergistaceae bacterium]
MDGLLQSPGAERFFSLLGRSTVKDILSDVLGSLRRDILNGVEISPTAEAVLERALPILKKRCRRSLLSVVNATGVVVHTNLGRSCLAAEAVHAVIEAASGYSTLEFDLDGGKRGHRSDHVEWLLCRITGAEAGIVVNNNAGAVLLMLAALCAEREVIVSRGELVEIGGSFRIPDIMAFSGARLVEVGATNRTHRVDYEGAMTEGTAALLKVHPSNFRMEGFVSSVPREDLAALAREKKIFFLEDLGSGTLVDLSPLGLRGEPTVADCIREGVDLVTFSGDKMLGGPQIGAIVGKKALIDRLRTYPLLRALRVDKMTLAAFEATLRLYLTERTGEIPTLAMISASKKELRKRAKGLGEKLKEILPGEQITLVEVDDAVGGGAFPAEALPGWGVALPGGRWGSAGNLLALLRQQENPVVAGAREDEAIFHVRTLLPGDEEKICHSLKAVSERE